MHDFIRYTKQPPCGPPVKRTLDLGPNVTGIIALAQFLRRLLRGETGLGILVHAHDRFGGMGNA